MPGVPSGKGCEGCRKRKKKCDETTPSCSRCARLHVACVGSGQQRYKFVGQPGSSDRSDKGQVTKLATRPKNEYPLPKVSGTPSNELTLLVCSFIDTIGVSTDLRYNLAWSYGGFLEMVPRRLGTNVALNAAAEALVSAHRYFCSSRANITGALTKYSRALKILRACLDDPVQARTSEILCSVYLLLICQGLLGAFEGRWTGHGEGAVQILKARGYYKPQDDFESQLLLSLRGPVLFEGLFNNKIRMSSWEWKTLVENELDGVSYEGRMMRCLARYPDLMRLGRHLCKGKEGYFELLEELRTHHHTLKGILEELHRRLVAIDGAIANGIAQSPVIVQTHSHYQRSYGLCLVICIISNCVLNAVDVEDTQLVSESIYFSEEILALAKDAAIYRPIGAGYVWLCLIAAWVGTTDSTIRKMVEKTMAEYERDFAQGQAALRMGQLELLSQQLRLIDPDPY